MKELLKELNKIISITSNLSKSQNKAERLEVYFVIFTIIYFVLVAIYLFCF